MKALSAPGPAASLGIPEKNTFELTPTTIAGHEINYVVLDDASDTTKAVTNTRKLIAESKADSSGSNSNLTVIASVQASSADSGKSGLLFCGSQRAGSRSLLLDDWCTG